MVQTQPNTDAEGASQAAAAGNTKRARGPGAADGPEHGRAGGQVGGQLGGPARGLVHGPEEEADSPAGAIGRSWSPAEAAAAGDRSWRRGPGGPCRGRGGDAAAGWGLGGGG
jgi:hypothetical protein